MCPCVNQLACWWHNDLFVNINNPISHVTLSVSISSWAHQALKQAGRVINNSTRSIRGTERAPLLSMPLSSSCFKVSIQNKKQNLHSLPFVCIATAFSKYHSGKHALSYVPYFPRSLGSLLTTKGPSIKYVRPKIGIFDPSPLYAIWRHCYYKLALTAYQRSGKVRGLKRVRASLSDICWML